MNDTSKTSVRTADSTAGATAGGNAGGKLGEYAYTASGRERSTADLVRDIITNVQEMVRSEAKLAKAEFREETQKTLAGAKKMGIAAGAGFFALGFVLWSVALLLALVMPIWAATLVVGIALGLVAAVLYSKARSELQFPKPEKTIENVKENVEWMKNRTRS
jgi:uncharacterized membrane protein YqjE